LNRGPPAPKPGVLPLGSPSFSVFVLKAKELEKFLVVARCTEVWLRMRRVPRIFPIANNKRTVRDLTDAQALELQVIENVHVDVHPLDEAQGTQL
jgi:hypothetical protein